MVIMKVPLSANWSCLTAAQEQGLHCPVKCIEVLIRQQCLFKKINKKRINKNREGIACMKCHRVCFHPPPAPCLLCIICDQENWIVHCWGGVFVQDFCKEGAKGKGSLRKQNTYCYGLCSPAIYAKDLRNLSFLVPLYKAVLRGKYLGGKSVPCACLC